LGWTIFPALLLQVVVGCPWASPGRHLQLVPKSRCWWGSPLPRVCSAQGGGWLGLAAAMPRTPRTGMLPVNTR